MTKDPKIEILGRVPLFGGCSARVKARIAQLADEIDVPAGKVLMRQGESGQEFFVIVSGRVRIDRDGRSLRMLGAGDFLGEIALVDGKPRTATATVEEPSRLLVVEHRAFHSLMEADPSIQLEILRTLAERVRKLEPDAS
jgi:CRP/FNR family transcriptional regulator, cyclic AMP receptor protein